MMKTSRIVLWILCLALVASCTKNGNTGDDVPENGFRAKIEQTKGGGSKGNRTHINPEWDPNGYSETSLYWSEGDLIKVANHGGNGSTLTFQLTEGENTMYGTFYTGEQNDGFFEPDYMAAYPAANAEGTATTISGSTATFSMLSTQSYKANTFDEGAMPMVASSSTQTLNFRNVFGGLCVPIIVQGRGLLVTSVKLTSLNTNDKLWGVFSADCTSSNPLPTYVSGGDNTLTLDCGAGVALDATVPTDFYFMLPPGTLESGFTVTAYNGTTVLYEETADWTASPHPSFIPRRVIMKVNTNLEVVVDPLVVRTVSPTFITTNSAYGLGQVTSDPDNVFDRFGFLYMKYDDLTNPSNVATELVVNGTNVLEPATVTQGSVCYGADLSSLDLDTRYYVRAYAVDAIGRISYGDPILFATRRDYYAAGPYQGVMKDANGTPYEFSVAPGKKVYFSMGNLQYQASTNTWRFAEYQYEYVAYGTSSAGNYRGLVFTGGMYPSGEVGDKCGNEQISSSYTGWIDLFGWGTSGRNHGAVCYQPWSTNANYSDYCVYGNSLNNLNSQTPSTADWGYNAISNGGNTVNSGWRTLEGTNDFHQADGLLEWGYLLGPLIIDDPGAPSFVYNYRSGKRYATVALLVRGTAGRSISAAPYIYPACGRSNSCMIVFPDSFGTTWPEGVRSLACNSPVAGQYLTEAEWSLLEREGCVIMPCSGRREGSFVYDISGSDNYGLYWSANSINNSSPGQISILVFSNAEINPIDQEPSCNGLSVRLVRDAN